MDELGIEMARSEVAYSVEDGLKIADKLGYPVVLRPATQWVEPVEDWYTTKKN